MLVSSDVPKEKRNRMDMEQPTSPTPFSDQEDGSTRPPDLASSGKKAVNIGSHRSSRNENKFKVYLAKKKVQNNEYNELMQKPLVQPR